jgi:hypothetical protein
MGNAKDYLDYALLFGVGYLLIKGVKVKSFGQTVLSVGGDDSAPTTPNTPGAPQLPAYYSDTSKALPFSEYWNVAKYRLSNLFWWAN